MYPKLRDSKTRKQEPYPLGKLSKQHVHEISRRIVYLYAVGKADISGNEWADIFAKSIDADHLAKPYGLADVIKDDFAWSTKTLKSSAPHSCKSVRIISGRNSLRYSYGTINSHGNFQETGDKILGIWNARRRIALSQYDDLRIVILIRNINSMEFTIFETEVKKYNPKAYEWKVNSQDNIEGYEKVTNKHKFTWQPHGSQFTIKYEIPDNAVRFVIKRPPVLDFEETMKTLKFDESWVTIRDNGQI
jgi:hypothetical protein